jgi:hypothetical protein
MPMAATSAYLNRPARPIEEARRARARTLVPLARDLGSRAKAQADAIGTSERRFGGDEVRHLARLLDDLWMAADSFAADIDADP